MKKNGSFKIVNIADDYMIVPLGNMIETFNGTVIINETANFILEQMSENVDNETIIQSIINRYDVDYQTAKEDFIEATEALLKLGIIE